MTDLKNVEMVAAQYNWSKEEVAKKLRSLQSTKTRLKKMPGRSDYQEKMNELLLEEELLKQVRNLIDPKEKFVTAYEQEDVDQLDYDQTIKAIKSIQSAICNSQYETADINTNSKYQSYKKIEAMLLEHKKAVKPVEDAYIRKTEVQTIIDLIESTADITVATVLDKLKELI